MDTSFKEEFLAALLNGVHYSALLELVQSHLARGFAPSDGYDALQDIWLRFGFDKADGPGELQNNLEYIMERLWYASPIRHANEYDQNTTGKP